MSGLDKVQKSMQRKLSFADYNTAIPQNVIETKQQNSKKYKVTIYLDEESFEKLNKVCSKNVQEKGKLDKSALMCKAIDLLYNEMN